MSAIRTPAASLQQSIEQTIQTNRLGAIVSLRMLMSATADAPSQLAAWLNWAAALFGSDAGKVFASRDANQRQTSVLCTLASGATVSLTAVTSADDHTLQLLLIGQHGIARLEGGEEIDAALPTDGASQRWQAAIAESLRSNKEVEVFLS